MVLYSQLGHTLYLLNYNQDITLNQATLYYEKPIITYKQAVGL